MKIILVSSHFPQLDHPGLTYATHFLSDYAIELQKNGHQVTVIHLQRAYPAVFYIAQSILAKMGIHKFDKYVIDRAAYTEADYHYQGVHIIRLLYKKFIPHGSTSSSQVKNLIQKIQIELRDEEVTPNIIIGDCFDPVIPIAAELKGTKCVFGEIAHNSDYQLMKDKKIRSHFSTIDFWLTRSNAQAEKLSQYIQPILTYNMYSGVPAESVEVEPEYRTKVRKLLYVGALYQTKKIDTTLEALSRSNLKDMTLTIIGKGPDETYFKTRVKELNLEKQVEFVGAVDHDKVFGYMKDADALVMISKETFGMVYVEAMSQGCVVMAAKDEGIDGVVVNDENGFLTTLDDVEELKNLFEMLYHAGEEHITKISRMAYQTAKQMTSNELAKKLICNIEEHRKE